MDLLNQVAAASSHYPARSFSLDKRGIWWLAEVYHGLTIRTDKGVFRSGPSDSPDEALTNLLAELVKDRLQ